MPAPAPPAAPTAHYLDSARPNPDTDRRRGGPIGDHLDVRNLFHVRRPISDDPDFDTPHAPPEKILHSLAELRQQQLEGPDLTLQDFQNAARLGVPFKIVDNDLIPFRLEVAKRIAALNTAIGWPADASIAAADRARVRTQVAREFFLAEHGREPVNAGELAGQIAKDSRPRTQTVAGYDLTFSPVKSVSTLWAVADPGLAAAIEHAHQAAVKDALRFIEEHALFTRTGPQGIRQVNVQGLVATAFTQL
jgi:hypothetical protein